MNSDSVKKECFDSSGSLNDHWIGRVLDSASEGLGQYVALIVCWNVLTLLMVAVVSYVVTPFLVTFYSVSDSMVFIMQAAGYLLGILLTAVVMAWSQNLARSRQGEQGQFRRRGHGHIHRHA